MQLQVTRPLSEDSILLRYTTVGNIVLAVNPYRWLDLYSDKAQLEYFNSPNSQPPHIYRVATDAFKEISNVSMHHVPTWTLRGQ